jgi:hypothetical protein
MTARYPLVLNGTSIQEVQTGDTLNSVSLPTIPTTLGGTGNGFTKFTGPTTSEKTFTLPDSSQTLLYSGGALGTPASGTLTNCTGLPQAGLGANIALNGPVFIVNRSTTNQSISSGIDTVVLFNTAVVDSNSFYDTGTGKFQPTIAGYYLITTSLLLAGTSTTVASGSIQKNGNEIARIGTIFATFGTGPQAITGLVIASLNGSTDYIQVKAYITASSNTAVNMASTMTGCLLRIA